MRVGCAFYFEVDGIRVERGVAGKSVTTVVNDLDVRVDFPSEQDPFTYAYAETSTKKVENGEIFEDAEPQGRPPALEPSGEYLSVRVLRVVVNADAPDDLRHVPDLSDNPDLAQLRARMRPAATVVVERLTQWVRSSKGQVWNPPSSAVRRQIGSEQMVDLETMEALPIMWFAAGNFHVLPRDTEMLEADFDDLGTALKSEQPLWSQVLSDARYYATWSSEWSAPQKAVLFAAIASELAVKDALRAEGDVRVQEMIEILLENPRD